MRYCTSPIGLASSYSVTSCNRCSEEPVYDGPDAVALLLLPLLSGVIILSTTRSTVLVQRASDAFGRLQLFYCLYSVPMAV